MSQEMRIRLAYGQHGLTLDLPQARTTVIEPSHVAGLADEQRAVVRALEHPIATRPLRDWIKPGDRICITFSDLTRPTPNNRLIPWLLRHLSYLPQENIILINQTGTHRPNNQAELEELLTPAVARGYRVLNHEPENPAVHVQVGKMRSGAPAMINRHVAEADVRIITGFIEPHIFAGFSGGPKGIMPGTASLETVMSNHGVRNIDDPKATFGVTEGNPVWEEMRDIALCIGPSFLLNVSLNKKREIAGVFAGDMIQAHREGCEFVRRSAMRLVSSPFDIVITTNSGYPLDLNLYQGIKGMAAGARILKPGGLLILACECREGIPEGSSFDRLLRSVSGPEQILETLHRPGFLQAEQWQAQIHALIQQRAQVLLYSSLPDDAVRTTHLVPCKDIGATVQKRLAELGEAATVAVLPQGPLTIPCLKSGI
jgi:nickel-dependent lactate racemase